VKYYLNYSCLTTQNALSVTNTVLDSIEHCLKQVFSTISDKKEWIFKFTKHKQKLKKNKKDDSKLLQPQNLHIYLDSEPDEESLR